MEEDKFPSRKRAEILFDDLKAIEDKNNRSKPVKMKEDKFPSRKQAEKLFDDLKAIEDKNKRSEPVNLNIFPNTNKEQTAKRKYNEINGTHEYVSKQKVVQEENKKSNVFERVVNTTEEEPTDIMNFKCLLQEIDNEKSIEELCASLTTENKLTIRCQSALSLAVLCHTQTKKEDCRTIIDALLSLPDQQDSYAFEFCLSLLLHMMTRQTYSLELIRILEKAILKVAHSVICQDDFAESGFMEAKIVLLGGERYLSAYKLCQKIFHPENIDINLLDVSSLCCSSLRNLSKLIPVTRGCHKFSDDTLNYILTMIGKSTQEIVLENLVELEEEEEIVSISAYTVSQCLQVLEQILCADPDSSCKTLSHEEFSLLRCLTKLLEWNMTVIFPTSLCENVLFKVENAMHAFYLSTLVSILKVFSILSFHPDQYDSFTNVKGSMEKFMLCILKIYFQSQEKHFDALVLALEMMINFSLKCKKTFILLCLKKFKINGSEELLAVEALLQILDASLTKISEVKLKPGARLPTNENQSVCQQNESSVSAEQDINIVLEAADEDMELSMIVSFIGILLMYFIDAKKSFSDFVRDRLSTEKCLNTVDVSRKFLQFSQMTGGMPITGILLLKTSITTLSQLHSS